MFASNTIHTGLSPYLLRIVCIKCIVLVLTGAHSLASQLQFFKRHLLLSEAQLYGSLIPHDFFKVATMIIQTNK